MKPTVYQVTTWSRPEDNVLARVKGPRGSEHALVRYDRWLNMEIERWATKWDNRSGWIQTNTEPVTLEDGTVAMPKAAIAMFSWAGYQKPVREEE